MKYDIGFQCTNDVELVFNMISDVSKLKIKILNYILGVRSIWSGCHYDNDKKKKKKPSCISYPANIQYETWSIYVLCIHINFKALTFIEFGFAKFEVSLFPMTVNDTSSLRDRRSTQHYNSYACWYPSKFSQPNETDNTNYIITNA